MDAYEDLEAGEEVDYDYPLDDDFFEDGKSRPPPARTGCAALALVAFRVCSFSL